MLSFLRTHQKAILASTGALVIFSMCFFGIAQKSQLPSGKKGVILGKAMDGSSTRQEEIDAMALFFTHLSDPRIGLLSKEEDIFMKDVVSSGLALMLIENYWPLLEKDLEPRLESYRHFRPYAHPEMHFVNAENIWMRFAPNLYGALEKFREEQDPKIQVKHLIDCVMAENQFPEQMLRQILFFQERQFNPEFKDPYIQSGNLALFNARSIYEIFGPKFMELATEFIYNAAMMAKANGKVVTKEEARASLICLAGDANKKGKEIKPKEAKAYFAAVLRKLQISDKKAVEYWQKLLLFRRIFEEVNSSIYLDSLVYDSIGQFSHEELTLNLYAMPKPLCIDSFDKMMKLEIYLDHMAKRPHDKPLNLSLQFLSPDRVKSRCPKLVAKKIGLEVAKVNLHEVSLQISLKDILQYEIDHFDALAQHTPELALKDVEGDGDKLALLQFLEPAVRKNLDDRARKSLLSQHREFIDLAFVNATKEKREITLNLDDQNSEFIGFEDNNALIEKLEKAFAEGQKTQGSSLVELKGGGEELYQVEVTSVSPDYEVLTFEEADQMGVLDKLLADRLEREYPSIRSLYPSEFKNEAGAFLPLDEVKEEVGKYVFQDLITQIQNYVKNNGIASDVLSSNLDTLASYRLAEFMSSAMAALQAEGDAVETFIKKEEEKGLESQFKLALHREVFSRAKPSPLMDENMFRMKEKEWSSLALLPGYGLAFYKLESKRIDDEEKSKAMQKGYDILIEDAKRGVLYDLLEEMKVEGVLHVQKEEEVKE